MQRAGINHQILFPVKPNRCQSIMLTRGKKFSLGSSKLIETFLISTFLVLDLTRESKRSGKNYDIYTLTCSS